MAKCFLQLTIVLVVGWNLQTTASPFKHPFVESKIQLDIFHDHIRHSVKELMNLHNLTEQPLRPFIMKNTKILSTHLCSTKYTFSESLGHIVKYFWDRLQELSQANEKVGENIQNKREEIYNITIDNFRALKRDLLGNAAIRINFNEKSNLLSKKMQATFVGVNSATSVEKADAYLFNVMTKFFKPNKMIKTYLTGKVDEKTVRKTCKSKKGKKHKKSA